MIDPAECRAVLADLAGLDPETRALIDAGIAESEAVRVQMMADGERYAARARRYYDDWAPAVETLLRRAAGYPA